MRIIYYCTFSVMFGLIIVEWLFDAISLTMLSIDKNTYFMDINHLFNILYLSESIGGQ